MIEDVKIFKVRFYHWPEGASKASYEDVGMMLDKNCGVKDVTRILSEEYSDIEIMEATVVYEGDLLDEE